MPRRRFLPRPAAPAAYMIDFPRVGEANISDQATLVQIRERPVELRAAPADQSHRPPCEKAVSGRNDDALAGFAGVHRKHEAPLRRAKPVGEPALSPCGLAADLSAAPRSSGKRSFAPEPPGRPPLTQRLFTDGRLPRWVLKAAGLGWMPGSRVRLDLRADDERRAVLPDVRRVAREAPRRRRGCGPACRRER